MAEWRKYLTDSEKKDLARLEKRGEGITAEIRRLRNNATQRMARAKRKEKE